MVDTVLYSQKGAEEIPPRILRSVVKTSSLGSYNMRWCHLRCRNREGWPVENPGPHMPTWAASAQSGWERKPQAPQWYLIPLIFRLNFFLKCLDPCVVTCCEPPVASLSLGLAHAIWIIQTEPADMSVVLGTATLPPMRISLPDWILCAE